MKCKICSQKINISIFTTKILNKYSVRFYHCLNCDFLQSQEPYWLDEAYSQSINTSDTGILQRNIDFSKFSTTLICLFFDKQGKFLDYAGGYGIFTRLLRDIGLDFYWSDKFSQNLVARGFEKKEQKFELLSVFEAFEHFENPSQEIENMLKLSKNILFSTQLYQTKPPKPEKWWYYGFEHGQHISFYSIKTLNFIAKKYNLHLASNGLLHLFSQKKISNLIFKNIPRLNNLGLFHLFKKTLKSKTLSDYQTLKGIS